MKRLLFISIPAMILLCLVFFFGEKTAVDDGQTSETKLRSAQAYAKEYARKKLKRQLGIAKSDAPDEFVRFDLSRRTPSDLQAPAYSPTYLMDELNRAKGTVNRSRRATGVTFQERGPGNVAGRTRSIIVDPRDTSGNTWIAGSVSGGVWKTTDGGDSWTHLTQELPNLATSTVAVSPVNYDVIYCGTGEPFYNTDAVEGFGVFKSTDGGDTWTQIASPEDYRDFRSVSRIIVHPENPDIVFASATSRFPARDVLDRQSSIFRTTNGGESWDRVYSTDARIDDLDFNPFDQERIYAAVQREGVLRSEDGGESWEFVSSEFQSPGRIEIAHSTVDSSMIWASVEGTPFANLYRSVDHGETWSRINVQWNENDFDFLGGQGWYDNILVSHPFEANSVYVGGVDLFRFDVDDNDLDTSLFFDLSENNTDSYLSFINFGGIGNGGIDYGQYSPEELPRIEIRFGQGSQKAYRFTVGGRGAGVPDADYIYEDYTEVPFQVWDVSNNRQLAASFRDQGEDGAYNLIPFSTNPANALADSREYIYIHLQDYTEDPIDTLAQNGGIANFQAYFIWPVANDTAEVDLTQVVPSSLVFDHPLLTSFGSKSTTISDAYEQFDGKNNTSDENYMNGIGNHPDQHDIYIQVTDVEAKEFRLIVANDGGVYVSDAGIEPGEMDSTFRFAGYGYNTTQFYGADKAPGTDRYIGGMQDNSTWYTMTDEMSGPNKHYTFAFGGDGFESIWNNRNADHMIGSVQGNLFFGTDDGGETWAVRLAGFDDFRDNGGGSPFLSKLTNARVSPDRLYTVGGSGVWFSEDFGSSWSLSSLDGVWTYVGSGTDVTVSEADYSVVWAGGFMGRTVSGFELGLHVSEDGGRNFTQVEIYDEDVDMGNISSIATHPTQRETAYALFSFADRPKILRTQDMGQTWEDITGFETERSQSTNGFPNVAVNCLYVFPNNPDRLWAGTEIGIVESMDNGESWQLLENEMGYVSVWDMKLQDDQVVIASHGRGIWTATIDDYQNDLVFVPVIHEVEERIGGGANVHYSGYETYDSIHLWLNDEVYQVLTTEVVLNSQVSISPEDLSPSGNEVQIVAYKNNREHRSLRYSFDSYILEDVLTTYINSFDNAGDQDDFYGEGFVLAFAERFGSDPALQTKHPYNSNQEIYQLLRHPIRVENQILSYYDVAIIEPGLQDAEFGTEEFFDFVVVEGSSDGGEEWIPLAPGYDATRLDSWSELYSSGDSPDSSLFAFNAIHLTDHFESGDTVLIRFRLFADPLTTGWGWLIDDLRIEDETVSTELDLSLDTEVVVYPNPTSDEVYIDLSSKVVLSRLSIFDVSGKQLQELSAQQLAGTFSVDLSAFDSGVYFVQMITDDNRFITKKIVKN